MRTVVSMRWVCSITLFLLWVSSVLAEDPAKQPYENCNLILKPSQDYNHLIASLPSRPDVQNICFVPGKYTLPLIVKGKTNLLLLAPQGDVDFAAEVEAKPGKVPYGVMHFEDCENIEMRGIAITNSYQYRPSLDDTSYSEVSCGIFLKNSKRFVLFNVNLHTRGKQGLYLDKSSADLIASTIQAGYMELVSYSSKLRAKNIQLIQNYSRPIPPLANDRHPMMWAFGSSQMTFENTSMVFHTGIGFVVSNQTPTYSARCPSANPLDCSDGANHIVLSGDTTMRTSNPVKFPLVWSQHHVSHSGLLLELNGNYPLDVQDYWQNPVKPIGPSTPPNLICKYPHHDRSNPVGCATHR